MRYLVRTVVLVGWKTQRETVRVRAYVQHMYIYIVRTCKYVPRASCGTMYNMHIEMRAEMATESTRCTVYKYEVLCAACVCVRGACMHARGVALWACVRVCVQGMTFSLSSKSCPPARPHARTRLHTHTACCILRHACTHARMDLNIFTPSVIRRRMPRFYTDGRLHLSI